MAVRDVSSGQQAEDPRRLAEVQSALKRVATLVASGPPPSEVFAAVAAEVGRLLAVSIIAIFRYDSDDQATVVGSWGPIPYQLGAEIPLDGPSVTAAVLGTGRPARIDDWSELSGTIADAVRRADVCSVVGVPIVFEGRTWGLVSAASLDRVLPDETEGRLSEFTSLVATALSNAQSREDLSRYVDEQAALRRVATLVASGADPDEIFSALAEGVADVLAVPAISMIRYENDGTATKVGGWGDVVVPVGTRWELDDPGVMAKVAETGRPARIDDYRSVPGAHAQDLRARGITSSVGAPIVVNGSTWGAIVAFSADSGALALDAEERLARFTELVGTAVSNAQARDDLRRLADEQAALRHVAELVAEGTEPEKVFAAVAEGVANVLNVPAISMVRFEPDESSTAIAVWGDANPFGVGATFQPWPGVMLQVRQTGRPARLEDYAYSTGPTTARLLTARIHSGVGVPINVEGRVWGTIIALATGGESLPTGIEARLSSFTELVATAIANTQARDALHELVDEQASLRRVATLVAEGAPPADVFKAVAEAVAQVSGVPLVEIARFDPDGTMTVVGHAGDHPFRTGTRWPLDNPEGSAAIHQTGQAIRVEYTDELPGVIAETARKAGMHWALGVPIMVDGRVWGSIGVARSDGGDVPAGAEARLAGFTELVATAISNTTIHSQLLASRARIVAATDETRRRIERNLHDGTQQQLVAVGLDLQALKATVPAELSEQHAEIDRIQSELDAAIDDVREISRGVHPALLSHAGLRAALKALARRSPVPVELQIEVERRLSQSIEIAAYYVASEALANAAKHSNASVVHVNVAAPGETLTMSISDDGVGGARVQSGTGLMGLVDRVEALGGSLALESRPGKGTTISVDLPLEGPAIAS